MIDSVGGVDIDVTQPIDDPEYDNVGFSSASDAHHLDGKTALAYVRSRKGLGDSDFTRAIRQQQVLVALRDAVTQDGSVLWKLPGLMDAVGDAVRTDMPPARLPQLAALMDEIDDDAVRGRSSAIHWCDRSTPATDPRSSPTSRRSATSPSGSSPSPA